MFKILLYQLKYEFYKISFFHGIFFAISLVVMGIILYTDGLESDFYFLFFWAPGSIFANAASLDRDAVRLIPMTDNQFKGFIIMKGLGNSLIASFLTAMCAVPGIIRWKLSVIVLLRIMMSVYFYSIILYGYKYKCKGKIYPGTAFNIVNLIIFAAISGIMVTDIRTYSTFIGVAFAAGIIAQAGALMVHYIILNKIPLGEISFDVTLKKRKGEIDA